MNTRIGPWAATLAIGIQLYSLGLGPGAHAQARDDEPAARADAARPVVVDEHSVAPRPRDDAPSGPRASARNAPSELPPNYILRPAEREWYGWQTLLLDGLSLTAVGLPVLFGANSTSPGVVLIDVVAFPTLFLGTPITHMLHGNIGRGFASLGMRLGSALMIAVGVEMLVRWQDRPANFGTDAGYGLIGLGILTATAIPIIDSAAFAYRERPASHGVEVSVTPWLERASGSFGLRASGTW
jgi:hypothetical protein